MLHAKKLTLTIYAEVYEGLHKIIGPRNISKFIEELVRPHVILPNLDVAYTKMARDKDREKGAMEWAEITAKDMNSATE